MNELLAIFPDPQTMLQSIKDNLLLILGSVTVISIFGGILIYLRDSEEIEPTFTGVARIVSSPLLTLLIIGTIASGGIAFSDVISENTNASVIQDSQGTGWTQSQTSNAGTTLGEVLNSASQLSANSPDNLRQGAEERREMARQYEAQGDSEAAANERDAAAWYDNIANQKERNVPFVSNILDNAQVDPDSAAWWYRASQFGRVSSYRPGVFDTKGGMKLSRH